MKKKTERIVTVQAKDKYDLCFSNDVGGNEAAPLGEYRVRVTQRWNDHETGARCSGVLVDPAQIETLRALGTTGHAGQVLGTSPGRVFSPERVFFANRRIVRPVANNLALLNLALLKDIKALWDREGFGSEDRESEPLYNRLTAAIRAQE